MKDMTELMKQITMVTQFALSLLTPTVMCLLLCWYLQNKCGIGMWIYIVGFVMGLGSSFMVAFKLYQMVIKKDAKENRQRNSFNTHI